MKKLFLMVLLSVVLSDSIETANHQSRVVKIILKNDIKIKSDDNNYFLRLPYGIHYDKSLGYFVLDNDQVTHLDINKKFRHNLIKRGEGPGEFSNVESFVVSNKEIIVHQVAPNKVAIFDLEGNLKKEIRPPIATSKLITKHENYLYFLVYNFDSSGANVDSYVSVTHELIKISDQGEAERTGVSFPVRWYSKKYGNALVADTESEFLYTVHKSRYLIYCYSTQYKIEIFDLKTGITVGKIVNPNYIRQPYIKSNLSEMKSRP